MFFKKNRSPVKTSIGMLDTSTSSFMSGWCCKPNRSPAPINIYINGEHIYRVEPNIRREDLISHGVDPNSGFALILPSPLNVTDEVKIIADDGYELVNSSSNFHRERLKRLLDGIIIKSTRGLEVGPLDRPVLSRSHSDVRYVDHASAEDLRKKYAGTPAPLIYADRIAHVDYVWSEGNLIDRVGSETKFDYCIAAHVMEHVGNPIGWLKNITDVLKPGGIIALVLPEQSRSFDYRRAFTRPSDLIEAYLLNLTRPNMRQVFDHVAFASPFSLHDHNSPLYNADKLKDALISAKSSAMNSAYFDVHCNVWNVQHFLECWDVIDKLDLLPLKLRSQYEPYPPHYDEFIVTFSKQ